MNKRKNNLCKVKLLNKRKNYLHKAEKLEKINRSKFKKSLINILKFHIMLKKLLEKEVKWTLTIGIENSKKLYLIQSGPLLRQ